jgi:hypothetical protein
MHSGSCEIQKPASHLNLRYPEVFPDYSVLISRYIWLEVALFELIKDMQLIALQFSLLVITGKLRPIFLPWFHGNRIFDLSIMIYRVI